VRKAEGTTCPPPTSGAQTPLWSSTHGRSECCGRRNPRSATTSGMPDRRLGGRGARSRGGRRHGDRTRLATVAAVPAHVPHVEMALDRLRELIGGGVLDREDQEELTGQPLPLGPLPSPFAHQIRAAETARLEREKNSRRSPGGVAATWLLAFRSSRVRTLGSPSVASAPSGRAVCQALLRTAAARPTRASRSQLWDALPSRVMRVLRSSPRTWHTRGSTRTGGAWPLI
jgi:hypothetical protein